jgi:hypothetical protein
MVIFSRRVILGHPLKNLKSVRKLYKINLFI